MGTQYGVKVDVLLQDLSIPNSALELYNKVVQLGIKVDTLINNAGFGDFCDFTDSDIKKVSKMLHLNMCSLTELTHYFLKDMRKENKGAILNVASAAGFQPMPKFGAYAATKAYVLHFTEALHHELRKSGIKVSVLCPGATRTEFEKVASMEGSKLFEKSKPMDAKTVALAGIRGLKKNQMVIVPGFKNKFLSVLGGAIPSRRMVLWVSSKFTS